MRKSISVISLLCLVILFSGQSCVSFSGSSSNNTNAGPVGMFASTDKGETWAQASTYPTAVGVKSISGVGIYRVTVDPSDPDAMYLASRENGIFYTYDNAQSWQHVNKTLNAGFIYSIAVHPKNRCQIFATNGTQIFRSDDCSRSWAEMYRESRASVRITSLSFNQFSPYEIFLTEQNGDVMVSFDSGNSWTVNARLGLEVIQMTASPLKDGLVFMTTREAGLYRSEDSGKTWTSLSDSMKPFSQAKKYRRFVLHPTKQDTIYWISTYGILRSDNRGDSWTAMELLTPPGSADIYAFAVNPKNDNEIYYTATISDRTTFYKTIDGGKNWITKKMPSGQIPTFLRVHPNNDSMIFLGFTFIPKAK